MSSLPEKTTLTALGLETTASSAPPPDQLAAHREIQDTLALTWLAVADLQPAPDHIWQGIQAILQPPASPAPPASGRLSRLALTWGGWAAAAALALGWWLHPPRSTPPPPAPTAAAPGLAYVPSPVRVPAPAPPELSAPSANPDSALREELTQLRERLAASSRAPEPTGLLRPAILELRAPGTGPGTSSAAESITRLQQLVTRALQRDLLLRNLADPNTLILESGWPQAGWFASDNGQTIRHLNFPAAQWETLGLWKAPDRYYDPRTFLLWTPAADGLGYIGQISPTTPDPAQFQLPRNLTFIAESAPRPTPAGYLISETGTDKTTLLLTDLEPPPPGGQQIIVASNANGTTQQYPLQTADLMTEGSQPVALSLSSLDLPGGFTSFSLIQTSPTRNNTSTNTVILSSGPLPPPPADR